MSRLNMAPFVGGIGVGIVATSLALGCAPAAEIDTALDADSSPSAPTPSPERAICTRESGFTFHAARVPESPEQGVLGFHWRNGVTFLRVDGSCRYYVGSFLLNTPVVSGVLTEAEARQLAVDVGYSDWARLTGTVANGTVIHGTSMVLTDGESELLCKRVCEAYPAPGDEEPAAILSPWVAAADSWTETLWERGTPLTGAVRLAAFEYDKASQGPWPWGFAEWPLERPVEEFAVGHSAKETGGILLDGADAQALRALRDSVFQTPISGGATREWIPIDGGEYIYNLGVADVLPYEREDGIVPRRNETALQNSDMPSGEDQGEGAQSNTE